MSLYDISVSVRPDLPVWEGDPPVRLQRVASIEEGSSCNITFLEFSAHTGTHVDAPLHFVPGGRSIDALDPRALVGPVVVAEFSVARQITAADLQAAALPADTQRLLCKTSNSRLWREGPPGFSREFVGLAPDGAEWLVRRGIQLVGIDYLSIEGYDSVLSGAPVHHALLEAGLVVLEGLDLTGIEPGGYTLLCLPLKLQGSDGAPCRAMLAR
jgi:arylformamidase